MNATVLGVSAQMLTSVVTGLTLVAVTSVIFWLVLNRRPGRKMPTHKMLAWILLGGVALHATWGLVAVFVLRS